MKHLLRLVAFRYLKATPGRTFLTLFGILLGVAVIFAIDVVNTSVLASFRGTIDDVAGKTALEVGADTGVGEELLEKVRAVDGVATAVPVIQESVRDPATSTQLAVLGVDTLSDSKVRDYDVTAEDVKIEDDLAFLNDPRGVLVTGKFAERAGLKTGDTLKLETTLGTQEFTVRGTLAPRGPAKVFGGDLLLMDVYAAQVAFGRGKRFDRIDVVPARNADVAEIATRISLALEGKVSVNRPQRRSEEAERILASFRMGLSLASLVAIFVGGFIVYNALAIAVAQRRREIGILRAVGVTRGQILSLFVGEGLAMGTAGSVLGLGAGLLLARAVLGFAGAAISDLYLRVNPEGLSISGTQVVLGVAAGVAASFVAAFFPARNAAFIEPASAMRKEVDASDLALSTATAASLRAAGVTVLLAAVVAVIAHVRQNYILGYGVAGILAFAAAFLSPALARGIGVLARRLATRAGPSIRLGVDGFGRNAARNAVTIAALGMALANVVNVTAFLDSMKQNTVHWFERSIRADVFVFAGREVKAKFEHPLPPSIGAGIEGIDSVEFVNPFRMVRQSYRGEPFYLISHDLERYRRYNEIPMVEGNLEAAMKEIDAGSGIAASEAFAQFYKVRVGDHVALQTPDGPRDFRISMVYVDYTADIGLLCTTRENYVRIWKDTLVDSYGVYLRKGAPADPVRDRILADYGKKFGLLVLENRQYQLELLALIDRAFALTRAMELVAIVVAVLGIVNTLLVTVIDRRMEIGILKAIGAEGRQVRRMFVTEASLIGFCATVVGAAFGAVFSFYIVKELLRFQTGWTMAYQFPWKTVLEIFVLAQGVAAVGAWWPARQAARLDVVDALEYE